MRTLVYAGPDHLEIEDRPYPALNPGEVIIRIEAAGVCGSDMHAYHGRDPRRKPGLVLGHEFAGTVVESADEKIGVGTRVTANPLITCGHCDYCLQGRSNLCANRTMVGMTRPGAFAEFMSIPSSSVVVLPEGLSAVRAALTEPAATALHAVNLSMRVLARPIPECRVLVIGGGAIGILSALLLHAYGCREITVAETNALRRDSIREHVAARTCDPVSDVLERDSYDYVIDAVGASTTLGLALTSVKPGGVVSRVGLHSDSCAMDARKLTLGEVALIGSYTYTTVDMRATVLAIHEGVFGALDWVEVRNLTEGAAAFNDLDKGRTPSAKIVLKPEEAQAAS
jgi:alcohol dehydrogenase